jgi:uncharacterized protein DUF1877
MSMIGGLRRLGEVDLDLLVAAPDQVIDYLYPDEQPPTLQLGPYADLDIDKAWHVLHFLMTGEAWGDAFPLGFLVAGGEELGEDMGYGPPRAFRPGEVKEIATALAGLDGRQLTAAIDPQVLAREEIYPHFWEAGDEGQVRPWILDTFEKLRDFVVRAAEAREALLVWLS